MKTQVKYELYPYQAKIKNSLSKACKINNKVLCYASTGAGKTIIAKSIIDSLLEKGKTVLFTVPRIKLATQTRDKFGYGNLILGSKTKDEGSNLSISSIQSFYSRKITTPFDFIIIDECHYANGSEYLKYIFETYKDSKIIGLSATPIDENGYMLQGYDDIIKEVTVQELIDIKKLCGVEVYTSLYQPKIEDIPIVSGDYNQTQASKVFRENKVISNALSEWTNHAEKLKTLVFATDIEHAEKLKVKFDSLGHKCDCVHSKMKDKDIQKAYSDFNLGEIQVLINVDMATFGFDQPDIMCLLFVRPVKSLRLYKQMIGRGLRTSPNKEKCLILDCSNVILDNGYPTDEIPLIKKPVVSQRIDSIVNLEREVSGEVSKSIPVERIEYLTKISSLFDLYSQKTYLKESDFQDDVKTFLKRVELYFWRQNSGKLFKEGRWIHFTDKNGLPDISLIYKQVYIGIELKMKKGTFTKHQKITLPEMMDSNVNFFVIDSFDELFLCLEILNKCIVTKDGVTTIHKIELTETQVRYRNILKPKTLLN